MRIVLIFVHLLVIWLLIEVRGAQRAEILRNGVLRESCQICYESLLAIEVVPAVYHVADI